MIDEETPHIVKDFMVGHTRIRIADNYCRNKSKEEVEELLRKIARTVQPYLSAQAAAAEADEASKQDETSSVSGATG